MFQALKTPAFSLLFEVDFCKTYLISSAENSPTEDPNLKMIPPQTPSTRQKQNLSSFTENLATALL